MNDSVDGRPYGPAPMSPTRTPSQEQNAQDQMTRDLSDDFFADTPLASTQPPCTDEVCESCQ